MVSGDKGRPNFTRNTVILIHLRITRQNIVFHEIFQRGDALKNIAFSDTIFKIRMSFMNIDDGQFIRRPFVLSPVELDR